MKPKKVGRPKKLPNIREMLEDIIPASEIFKEDEEGMYKGLIIIFLGDFDESQLTANDFDDIMSIAMSKVLEIRLLKASRDDPDMQIDTSTTIEKLRKQTEKLKENLATRRKDRIDPKKFSGFSVVDLAVKFDDEKKRKMFEKATGMRKEEEGILDSELLIGNKNDEDAEIIREEE